MLNLAIDEGVRVTAQTSETNGENGTLDGSMAPPTSVFGSTEGRISQVAPNLVYIEGMQGSVPLWSEVSTASGDESFEVIKELDDEVLVARSLTTSPDLHERVIGVSRGDGDPGRPPQDAHPPRVHPGGVQVPGQSDNRGGEAAAQRDRVAGAGDDMLPA